MQRSVPLWPAGRCGNEGEETKKVNKGARGMPVALGGEEGRDKLRKAAVRGKCPVTRPARSDPGTATKSRGEPGELKHLSTRRKRK